LKSFAAHFIIPFVRSAEHPVRHAVTRRNADIKKGFGDRQILFYFYPKISALL